MSIRRNWTCLGLLLLSACGTANTTSTGSSENGAAGADGGGVNAEAAKWVSEGAPLRRVHGHFPGDLVKQSGTPGFWWIGAESTDTSAIPNSGVRATIQSVAYAPVGGCFDCWTSNMLSNQYWGQIGFSACDASVGPAFTAFYQIWNTGVTPNVLLVDGETTAVTAGIHEFAMSVESGTVWQYALDGVVFGSYDMGSATADASYGVATLCEEGDGVAAPFVPPQVAMPASMDVLQSGTWGPAVAADVYNTAGLSGVYGHLQDAGLPDEAVIVGGTATYLAAGTPLWTSATGGEAPDAGTTAEPPAFVVITSPAAAATVNGSVEIDSTVTTTTALANVAFYAQSATTTYSATPCTLTSGPYNCAWDTTAVANGQYYLTVEATDVKGIESWADIEVTVNNLSDAGADGGVDGGGTDGGGTVVDAGGGDSGGGDAAIDSGSVSGEDAGEDSGNTQAGSDSGTDSGVVVIFDDAGTLGTGPSGEDSGLGASEADTPVNNPGCSCEQVGRAPGGGAWGLVGGLALLLCGGRRRRRAD
ncbi:MAG: Ig-like domain-containing protein [Polyangiaceae bacterium]